MAIGCAASVAVSRVLTGPVTTVTVTATLPSAVYLSTLDPDTPAVCLVATDGIRVPCAAVLPAGVPVPQPPVGSAARIGDGKLEFGGFSSLVTRWWRPSQPVIAGAVGWLPVAHDVVGAGHADRLRSALVAARDDASDGPVAQVRAAVTALLGAGPGLTPVGDDVLAGALVTLVAAGRPPARVLGDAVRAALRGPGPAPTTVVSAALLAHAGRGECIPELGALLNALGRDPAAGPVADLLAVGHSSGAGLLLGVAVALEA